MRTTRRAFVAAPVAFAAFAALAIVKAPAKAAQFELRAGATLPVDHPSMIRAKQMWAAVGKESGGRLNVQLFPNGQLGGTQALLSQLRLGALHFVINLGDLPPIVPVVDVTNVGFAFKDENEAERAMDGPLGAYLRKEFEAKDLYVLSKMWDSGMRSLTSSSHPIRTPDDLKNFKVRVAPSKITFDFFKTLGSSPLPMGANEIYTALQTKVVDGNDISPATIEGSRFYEVQKYLSVTNHTWSGVAVVTNLTFWKTLPSDLQAIVERNNTKYGSLEWSDSKALNAALIDKLGRQGLAVNRPDSAAFRARLRPYYDNWAKEFGPTVWGLLQNSVSSKLG